MLLSLFVQHLATLLTDLPLDEPRLGGVLMDISHTALSGSIQQHGMSVYHTYGDAQFDTNPREITVRCLPINTVPKAALTELRKHGFFPACALEFDAGDDSEARLDAWSLLRVYSEHLRGWTMTCFIDFDEAAERTGSRAGLLHAPIGSNRKGVLISANTLMGLA